MTLEFFPKDTVILSAGHPASESLYVVHKGGVKLALRSQVGKQLVLDMRSEGEIFGLLSILGKDLARLDVTAIEDTLCYRIPAEQMQRLISSHAEVVELPAAHLRDSLHGPQPGGTPHPDRPHGRHRTPAVFAYRQRCSGCASASLPTGHDHPRSRTDARQIEGHLRVRRGR